MLNLESLFQTLLRAPEPNGRGMLASPISGFDRHRLAKDAHGAPLVLISVPRSNARTRPAPIKLEHLSVQHDVECRISGLDGVIEEGQFTVIACVGADHALHTYFLRVLELIVMSLGLMPTRSEIAQAVHNLVELFRTMTAAPRKSVQGLWSELFLICRAPDVAPLVEAWHRTTEDRYDFNQHSQRIEVKSVAGRKRIHHFSLEQLHPPEGTILLIASLFVEKAGAGTSLAELLDRVRHRISNNLDLLMQVDRIVGMTLGSNWRHAMDERFDYELARQSLSFYEVSSVPAVSPTLPPEVSNVHFTSDLSGVDSAEVATYRLAGGLFEAAL